MADFRPFRAWRYNPDRVDLSKVIAPPYDVISPAMQERLYENSPYNVVRLILNRHEPQDTEQNNRYTRARDQFLTWCENGILLRDSEANFYAYQQAFCDPRSGRSYVRSAFFGSLKLEPFEKGIVVPHEKTLWAPKVDRRKLLEATQTNFSPIFGLFEDAGNLLTNILQSVTQAEPFSRAVDSEGVSHSLWPIADPVLVKDIRRGFGQEKIYIADGHHRYQTALDYARDVRRLKGMPDREELPSDFLLVALVPFRDPGLVLFPTHRMIKAQSEFQSAGTVDVLKPYFEVEPVPAASLSERLAHSPKEQQVFGLIVGRDQGYFLTLKSLARAKEKMPAGKPEVWYRLDVNLLAYLIFSGLWQIPESRWEGLLDFTHSDHEAVLSAASGNYAATFLLKAPSVDVLSAMGKVRELMPQKSTYFYPKLGSGLLFHQHNL